ncbi:MAG: pyridoxal phosphate-dependent aminotransferase [Eubacteriales bacterium]|nr:pyridoxal phosphate-dependent aminotransferase [Eubacteriales bacterium]
MVSKDMLHAGRVRSAIRDLFEFGRKRAAEVGEANVYDFSLGNPSVPPPAEMTREMVRLLSDCDPFALHSYTSAPGSNETRDAIAENLNRRFGTSFTRRNLYITCGAAAALASIFRALTIDAGTEFIAFAPYFPEYGGFAAAAGGRLVVVKPDLEHFQIDFSALEQTISAHTQGVIINSPNNPSGVIYSEETLRTLCDLLRKKSAAFGHPIYLISDEPYRELNYTGVSLPLVTELYDAAIVSYSYSKSLSIPGDRIGYALVGNAMPDFSDVFDAIAGAARMMGYVCAPSLLQKVVAFCADQNLLPDLSSYRRNRDALYNGLTQFGYTCMPPDGAFYLFVQAPGGDGDRFSEAAKAEDILVVSGRSFGCPGYIRIAYCVSYETIIGALPGLGRLYHSFQP